MSQGDLFAPGAAEMGRQESVVLACLQGGEGITSTEALSRFGVARLAAVVFNLRKAGHDIRTERLSVERVHGEGKAKVGRYWLARFAPASAAPASTPKARRVDRRLGERDEARS